MPALHFSKRRITTINLWDLEGQYLVNQRQDRSSTTISPYLVGHCARQNVFHMLQYPKPLVDPRSLMVMRRGGTIHEDLQNMWKKMGIIVAEELALNHKSANPWTRQKCIELRISGRLDAILRIPPLYVAEIKTAKASSFERMVKDGPYEEYISQLMLYMYLTQIKLGIIFVENKDTQEHYQFDFKYDEKRIKKLIDHINLINHHVLSLTLPPLELKSPSFKCKRLCDYFEVCWSNNPEQHIEENREYLRELVKSQTFFDVNVAS